MAGKCSSAVATGNGVRSIAGTTMPCKWTFSLNRRSHFRLWRQLSKGQVGKKKGMKSSPHPRLSVILRSCVCHFYLPDICPVLYKRTGWVEHAEYSQHAPPILFLPGWREQAGAGSNRHGTLRYKERGTGGPLDHCGLLHLTSPTQAARQLRGKARKRRQQGGLRTQQSAFSKQGASCQTVDLQIDWGSSYLHMFFVFFLLASQLSVVGV